MEHKSLYKKRRIQVRYIWLYSVNIVKYAVLLKYLDSESTVCCLNYCTRDILPFGLSKLVKIWLRSNKIFQVKHEDD
jgi:hypothetical protein